MKELLFKLKKERLELTGKMRKLEEFRGTDEWNKLTVNHKELLDIQLNAMKTYLEVLVARCLDIEMGLDKENKSKEDKPKENNEKPVKIVIVDLGEINE